MSILEMARLNCPQFVLSGNSLVVSVGSVISVAVYAKMHVIMNTMSTKVMPSPLRITTKYRLVKSPNCASADKVLYARATVHARVGNGELAIADLRAAVAIDPKLRFQATNDQDFDGIRDDASFIDIVEPTPAEA